MKILKDLSTHIQALSPKQLHNYLIIFVSGIIIAVIGVAYTTYSKSDALVKRIKKLEGLANRSASVIIEHKRLMAEQDRLQELFTQDQKFDIKIFFEEFCKEQSVSPLKGWNTASKDVTPNVSEITLSASFKGLAMEKLVRILDALEKKEIIYVKDLSIRNEGNKQISCDIKLATTSYKRKQE